MESSLDVVVVGAGIGGLASALAMARAGHRVTIVERDDTPMPPDPESAFEWDRRGAPQVRHPHVFLGLARVILRDHFPDVLEALAEIGVEAPVIGTDGMMMFDEATLEVLRKDDDIRMLPCRRTTFEWVMRRTVLAEPGVELRLGQGVSGLEVDTSGDGPPTVTGLRLEDGTMLDSDLVIAATGRHGKVLSWLEEHGVEIPETSSDTGVVYLSRFYRTDDGSQFGFRVAIGAGLGVGVIGSDAGTYSITAVVDKEDREMQAHLRDSDRFDATMRLLPELADVAAADGVPIHPVHSMAGLINRFRRFTDAGGAPLAQGLLLCGDAHMCTNPAYGRGQALALRMATMIAEAVAEAEDLEGAARLYEARCKEQVEPWYHLSVLTDQMRPSLGSESANGTARPGGVDFGALSSSGTDPQLVLSFLRVLNLLDPPQVLMEQLPRLQASASEAGTRARPSHDPSTPRRKRPSRDDLLGVVA